MSEHRTRNVKEALDVVEELKKDPCVSAVILYGSQATGKNGRTSDTDLAVILKDPDSETEAEIGSMYSDKIDLALFHRLPLYIQFQVFRDGKTLYISDYSRLKEMKLRTLREYHDMQYYYEKRKKHIMTS